MPSKIVARYDFDTIKRLTEDEASEIPSLRTMNPYILEIMEEDGRTE